MKCDGVLPPLPDPEVWKVPPRALNPDQARRKQEVDEYLARRYCEQQYRIVVTTQNSDGSIMDWLDPASVPGSQTPPPPSFAQPPPPLAPPSWFLSPAASASANRWVQAPPPVLAPPPRPEAPMRYPWPNGLVRTRRQTMNQYIHENTTARSLEEYFRNLGPEVVSKAPSLGPDLTGCSTMKITPTATGGPAPSHCTPTGGIGGTDAPPGWSLCLSASRMYTDTSTKTLRECLRQIDGPPAIACDRRPVTECVLRMYKAAPPSQAAAHVCQLVRDRRCARNEPFDLTACAEAIKPLGDQGLSELAACIATSREPACRKAFTACLYRVTRY
jgi:hypothetical protein